MLDNEMEISVSYRDLLPGPVVTRGHDDDGWAQDAIAVVDYDGATRRYYRPVDLGHPRVLIQNGLSPSESDPRFHQQMVYAVASETIERFEAALGRRIHWRRSEKRGKGWQPDDILTLNLFPHAMRAANAFYCPEAHGVLFGYFAADHKNPGRNLPGQPVFTCLSHDIIVHEVTHAIVDGLRGYFLEQTNVDVPAFHEAFADLAALFQHFTHEEVLLDTLQRTGGRLYQARLHPDAAPMDDGKSSQIVAGLSSENPLIDLATQFGEASGLRGGLRKALTSPVSPDAAKRITEPHQRGSLLVAAVFDAFFSIYVKRTQDLFRIYRAGGGSNQPADLPESLARALCTEAIRTAKEFFITLLDKVSSVHVLIDCGVFKGTSQTGDLGTLPDVVANVMQETGGHVGLLVMTHRHADHIAGFSRCRDQFEGFKADAIWLPVWESEYDDKAKKFQEDLTSVAADLQSHFAARIAMGVDNPGAYRSAESMMFNATGVELGATGGTASNATALKMLKNDFGAKPEYYKASDTPTVPQSLAKVGLTARIFGPPPVDDLALTKLMDLKKGVGQYLAGAAAGKAVAVFTPFDDTWTDPVGGSYPAGAFAEYAPRPKTAEVPLEAMRRALQDAIGRAQPEAALMAAAGLNSFLNNQSLVVLFACGGKNLLFAGDAQGGNWEHWLYDTDTAVRTPGDELSAEAGAILAHLDLYKMGHHGSTNATPIPAVNAMAAGIVALCSTEANVYGDGEKDTEVPRGPLLDAICRKGTLIRSDSIPVTVDGRTVAATVPLPDCCRAGWMMGRRADSTMGINRMTLARAVFAMPIVESARQGSAA